MADLRARLVAAFLALMFAVGAGTIGYYVLGDGKWAPFECFYMTVITLTTVGFGETLPGMDQVEHARAFTVALLVFGTGTVVYFVSTLTAIIIEGDLKRALRNTRMRKQIQKLDDHVIVCGAGSTGAHAIEELLEYQIPVVAIDMDGPRLEHFAELHPSPHFKFIIGDATDDEVLEQANLAGARGIVAAMANDKDNLYLTVSARQTNPRCRIVARGSELQVLDQVVSPNYIGGLRMVSELLRPQVVKFLDEMRRDKARVRIEEVLIPDGSMYAGKSLAQMNIRSTTEILVLAVQTPGSEGYRYNPGADFVLEGGMTLVVLGPLSQVEDLRRQATPAA
jgi:voltage-gated potassium channel